ncbi:hypothetical protein M758_3G145200 [Ceratodon purpureus]|nr:hypothetical protein M758_3G145200 [Ceratodon purpureus]
MRFIKHIKHIISLCMVSVCMGHNTKCVVIETATDSTYASVQFAVDLLNVCPSVLSDVGVPGRLDSGSLIPV